MAQVVSIPHFLNPLFLWYPTGDNNGVYADAEADKSFAFDDQTIRKGFIRKVYLILMVSASGLGC